MSVLDIGESDGSAHAAFLADPQAKLDLLVKELATSVEQTGPNRVSGARRNLLRAEQILGRTPLLHGMREANHLLGALRGRALLSRQQLGMSRLPSETYLGIQDVVYTCAGVLYPKRRFALVFAYTAEENADVTASPWDTGSLCSHHSPLCRTLPLPPSEHRRVLFEKTCLPAPHYRKYLVHYVASCFRSPEDYLFQRNHLHDDPAQAMSADKWQSRLFEVRFRTSVPITEKSVLALFVPTRAGDRQSLEIRELFDRIKGPKATLHQYGNEDRLVAEVRECIYKHVCPEATP
jgi:hypothetical protein